MPHPLRIPIRSSRYNIGRCPVHSQTASKTQTGDRCISEYLEGIPSLRLGDGFAALCLHAPFRSPFVPTRQVHCGHAMLGKSVTQLSGALSNAHERTCLFCKPLTVRRDRRIIDLELEHEIPTRQYSTAWLRCLETQFSWPTH